MTTTTTRSNTRRLLAALTVALVMMPALASAGSSGSVSLSINLVGNGWEHLVAKSTGRLVPETTPAQAAVAGAAEATQSGLLRVYGPDEVRRILEELCESAVVIDAGKAMLTPGAESGWLEKADDIAYSI